jgi:tRNA-splicing ligase RtcB (3'-phosphate/5'-hydroxy nucleic acid ligase)
MKQLAPKLYSWASILDEGTRDQAIASSTMPFITPHLALMPDAHLGKGASIGSVIPTDGAVMPASVGVDIGCGMIAVRTQWTRGELNAAGRLSKLRRGIETRIPMSAGKYVTTISDSGWERIRTLEDEWPHRSVEPDAYAKNWRHQLGTLGGGNHFIEITADDDDRVWAFLHSGSRGIGNKIAQHHIRVAQQQKHSAGLPDRDLAYLVEDSKEFDDYIAELRWAQHFALLNREEMMDQTLSALTASMGERCEEFERINCHHNFTQQEHHFGQDLWITRKGAIEAREGQLGLIPGSMGTASYVVEGLGNRMSFNSAPHGAGRSYSRSRARKTFTQDQLREAMRGIEYRDSPAFIDEIPQAYKDIDVVMADAADLVKVWHAFTQLINCKGD